MKIRTGFVSNSSSSSFVAIGFRINTTPKIQEKLDDLTFVNQIKYAKSLGWNIIDHDYPNFIIGGYIDRYSDNEYYQSSFISFETMNIFKNGIIEAFPEVNPDDIVLHFGENGD